MNGRTQAPRAFTPQPLNGLVEICQVFKVGREKIKNWAAQGAPILIDGIGNNRRYTSEFMALMEWRLKQSQK